MKCTHIYLSAASVSGILNQESELLLENPTKVIVTRRYFLSCRQDRRELPDCEGAVSYIIQPPLDGSRIAELILLTEREDTSVSHFQNSTILESGGISHIFTAGIISLENGSEKQTADILDNYESLLNSYGMTVERNCVRTWFFCDDIDNKYSGLVKGRREWFEKHGLTKDSHYIASTGIFGTPVPIGAIVQMDAYAVSDPVECKQQYLYALSNLNRTIEYGVTFERGVKLEFGGSTHIIISGTASIDNKGAVLHIGDVKSQTLRMWENVEALLKEGGSEWKDIESIIVYLRNASDYDIVAPMFAEKFPDTPYRIVLGPVCRPDWLVEMECTAAFES